jgi:hypothetical protein
VATQYGWSEFLWGGGAFGEGGVISVSVNATGVEASGLIGNSEETGVANVSPTGVFATGGIGNANVEISFSVGPSGVEAIGEVGSVDTFRQLFVQVSGVEGVIELGESIAPDYQTWGGGYWGGPLGWGGILSVQESVTGVEASGELGTVSEVIGKAVVFPTGVEGTTALGEEIARAGASVVVGGVEAEGFVGVASPQSNNNLSVTGVEATAIIEDVGVKNVNYVGVTGVVGTSQIGTVEIDAKATVVVTGVFGTGRVGKTLVWGQIDTSQTPNWQPILEAA